MLRLLTKMVNPHCQRINYIYLFEFDPRNIDTPIDIFNDAVDETLVFLLLMLIYYKVSGDLDNQWMDLVVLLNTLFLHTGRRWRFSPNCTTWRLPFTSDPIHIEMLDISMENEEAIMDRDP